MIHSIKDKYQLSSYETTTSAKGSCLTLVEQFFLS